MFSLLFVVLLSSKRIQIKDYMTWHDHWQIGYCKSFIRPLNMLFEPWLDLLVLGVIFIFFLFVFSNICQYLFLDSCIYSVSCFHCQTKGQTKKLKTYGSITHQTFTCIEEEKGIERGRERERLISFSLLCNSKTASLHN